jgi:hypothetical protein
MPPENRIHDANKICKYFSGTKTITYFGQVYQLRLPSIALHAILSYFVRLEKSPFDVPSHVPQTRAEAAARGFNGVTKEDIEEYNMLCHTRTVSVSNPTTLLKSYTRSQQHDADWARTVFSGPSWELRGLKAFGSCVYTPGTLSGKWQGTLLVCTHPPLL